MILATPRTALSGLAAAALLTACVSNPPPPVVIVGSGAVIVDWTIQGDKIQSDCGSSGAASVHVTLADSSGNLPMEYVQSCTAFATTISGLVPDTYTASVELIDAAGNARTTSVNTAPFDVFAGRTVTVAVDFPANSFF
jgi:hypothetical protein